MYFSVFFNNKKILYSKEISAIRGKIGNVLFNIF